MRKQKGEKATSTLRYFKALVKTITEDGRLLGVVGSTAAVDRYDEIIDQSTWKLEHYKKNPVILWAHNLSFGEDRPPIGRADRVEVVDGELVFDIQFDLKDPFAADIFRKYKEKFLNAFSVGFIPHAFGYDEDDHTILMQNELLELSAVPVPANPEALQSLQQRSFAVRSWKSLVKEAEESQATHADEAADEADETASKPPATETQPEDKNPGEGIVATDSQPETDDGESDKGDEDGASSTPENPQLAAQRTLVAVMREATRQMQSALAQHNNAVRAEKGKTLKKGL